MSDSKLIAVVFYPQSESTVDLATVQLRPVFARYLHRSAFFYLHRSAFFYLHRSAHLYSRRLMCNYSRQLATVDRASINQTTRSSAQLAARPLHRSIAPARNLNVIVFIASKKFAKIGINHVSPNVHITEAGSLTLQSSGGT